MRDAFAASPADGMMLASVFLMVSTIRRPTWLGGQKRRYMADDSADAEMGRASRRSLGMYLIGGGVAFWLVRL
ncbi:MAG: hypothetical protein RIB46_09765 [Pseudomonadales bacterium]